MKIKKKVSEVDYEFSEYSPSKGGWTLIQYENPGSILFGRNYIKCPRSIMTSSTQMMIYEEEIR